MSTAVKNGFILLMILLLIVSVPWNRNNQQMNETLLGFPEWVVVAIACYFSITLINVVIWLRIAKQSPRDSKE
ncbi:hypothetical protein GZ77_03415 [Endozoicomonas montiporae]|uniref:Uncharacterized protein n=2 Tax=Endozoicomonas montiporae TaxID=1027273 RepID=A0A081NB23_9GAMM|nr:hypothetical protein [Endozoicomonas montiporae]AMO56647.1 hypothetical protein EZMO1_2571 [Endozoicomonas montiporae CL-33]KEQ15646.1 hypothetical protein GZ77_03415 [Endozoicomonas montiporae]